MNGRKRGKGASRYINVQTKRSSKKNMERSVPFLLQPWGCSSSSYYPFSMAGAAINLLKPLCHAHHDILHSVMRGTSQENLENQGDRLRKNRVA